MGSGYRNRSPAPAAPREDRRKPDPGVGGSLVLPARLQSFVPAAQPELQPGGGMGLAHAAGPPGPERLCPSICWCPLVSEEPSADVAAPHPHPLLPHSSVRNSCGSDVLAALSDLGSWQPQQAAPGTAAASTAGHFPHLCCAAFQAETEDAACSCPTAAAGWWSLQPCTSQKARVAPLKDS